MSELIAYRVKNWEDTFENGESKRYKSLAWFRMPNKLDGAGYSRLVKKEQHVSIWAAWVLILEVASRQPQRGILANDEGPLSPEDMSDITRFPEAIFKEAFEVLSNPDHRICWLERILLKVEDSNQFSSTTVNNTQQDSIQIDNTRQHSVRKEENRKTEEENTAVVSDPDKNDTRQSENEYSYEFVEFWKAYPLKKAKQAAWKIWKRRSLDLLAKDIICGVKRYNNSNQWSDTRFIPHPTTFLNQGRWEDEITENDSEEQDLPQRRKLTSFDEDE